MARFVLTALLAITLDVSVARAFDAPRLRGYVNDDAQLLLPDERQRIEERLAQFARSRLGDRPLVVVSNREPVSHVWRNRRIVPLIPASGAARLRWTSFESALSGDT